MLQNILKYTTKSNIILIFAIHKRNKGQTNKKNSHGKFRKQIRSCS